MRDATHITIIGDRSGSMQSVQGAAQQGINGLISEQKALPGDCTLLLADFDEAEPFRIVHDGSLASAPRYDLVPRGGTPLLDAVGLGIVRTGEILSAIPEPNRPDKVIFAIQTDGMENASREYSLDTVRQLIKDQTEKYGWQFLFLGTGSGSWSQGAAMGIQNVTRSASGAVATASSYINHSHAMSDYRRTGDARQFAQATNAVVAADGTVKWDEDEDEDTTLSSKV